ncbi:MopE-related protein [Polyangium aurulentum]|uniref:MopE-related protein n=1 Tax=Polyangium aurulentum TaxID=2567896 RepID=UPI0010AE9291|nr:MopE-related protein [Polyangium aurulentum]UQA55480.1 hypothetical protein E8A73_029550 [Polyangium aurulentum]
MTTASMGCAAIVGVDGVYSEPAGNGGGGAGGGQVCTGKGVEGCPCSDGPPEQCYQAPLETLNIGACKAGTQTCVSDVWGPCEGAVVPAEETCNGVDDDCDGEVDEGNPGEGADCMADAPGECRRGTMKCSAGTLACVSNHQPEPEKCDGLDNDCDGDADEGKPDENLPCDTKQKGICKEGTTRCDAEAGVLTCEPLQNAKPEVCGTDDDEDCDGGKGKAFFTHTFSSVDGWIFTGAWGIKKAASGCSDPTDDTTSSVDGMLAGVNVGGCAPQNSSGQLTSPQMSMNVFEPGSQIWLKYKRRLQTSSSMQNAIEVRDNVSSAWKPVWTSDAETINDASWQSDTIELTSKITAGASQFQLRWTYVTGVAADQGGWSIDDVEILDDDCQ